MTTATTLSVDPAFVREFALEGAGDFARLKAKIEGTGCAWAVPNGASGALIGYPIYLGSHELVDRILEAAAECGFKTTRTRARKVQSGRYIMIYPHEDWKDIRDFQSFRSACRAPRAVPSPAWTCIMYLAVDPFTGNLPQVSQ